MRQLVSGILAQSITAIPQAGSLEQTAVREAGVGAGTRIALLNFSLLVPKSSSCN